MVSFHGLIAGDGRWATLRGSGTGEERASRTSRRCTPKRLAKARIDNSSRSWAILICS